MLKGFAPRVAPMRIATLAALLSPSTANGTAKLGFDPGTKDCMKCVEAIAAPRFFRDLNSSLVSAPLAWKTTFSRQGTSRRFDNVFATRAIASSVEQTQITSESKRAVAKVAAVAPDSRAKTLERRTESGRSR